MFKKNVAKKIYNREPVVDESCKLVNKRVISDDEYESDRSNWVKEVGFKELQISFTDYKLKKEKAEKSEYLEIESYDEWLKVNIANTNKRIDEIDFKVREYKEMPKFKTIKKIGTGSFGSCYLIMKEDPESMFQLESKKDHHRELYCLKYITFAKVDKRTSEIFVDFINSYLSTSLGSEKSSGYYLSHPNIAKFYGCYGTDYFLTFIHEYLCCGMVEPIINDPTVVWSEEKRNILDVRYKKRLKFITAQVILALEYLHDLELVHGDVHLKNVCLDYRGYTKLIDFGECGHFERPFREHKGISNHEFNTL